MPTPEELAKMLTDHAEILNRAAFYDHALVEIRAAVEAERDRWVKAFSGSLAQDWVHEKLSDPDFCKGFVEEQQRLAVEEERERCVRKMRERCTYCDDGVVTFTARVPDPRNPYSEEALPEEQQERCQACGEQEAAMREGE